MKKRLQILALSIGLTFCGLNAISQVRMIPLTVSIVQPTNNSELQYNTNYNFIINIQNNSATENLLLGDTVFFNFTGEPSVLNPDNFYSFALPMAIPAGGNTSLTILQGPNDNTTGVNINKEYCIILVGTADAGIPGGTWSNSNPEAIEPTCVDFTLLPQTASINESTFIADWNLYPNPANEQINLSAEYLSSEASVVVHNAVGQRIYESKAGVIRNTNAINTQDWESGIYIVTIYQNGTNQSKRVMVQH